MKILTPKDGRNRYQKLATTWKFIQTDSSYSQYSCWLKSGWPVEGGCGVSPNQKDSFVSLAFLVPTLFHPMKKMQFLKQLMISGQVPLVTINPFLGYFRVVEILWRSKIGLRPAGDLKHHLLGGEFWRGKMSKVQGKQAFHKAGFFFPNLLAKQSMEVFWFPRIVTICDLLWLRT